MRIGKDIVGFFEKHGCTKAGITLLRIKGEKCTKRHEVIDVLFFALAARPDNGLDPFRAMLQSLLNWSHFDTTALCAVNAMPTLTMSVAER